MFYKLADLADVVGSINENEDFLAPLESGKLFLLELLDAVVTYVFSLSFPSLRKTIHVSLWDFKLLKQKHLYYCCAS